MRAEEFYPAYQTSFEGIGKIIDQAYHGYDDSTPIMVHPDSSGQVEDIGDDLIMQILGGISYDHYQTSPNPAIRSTTVNLYGERKGQLDATEESDAARYMVVAASAVIDLDATCQEHSDIFEHVHQILNIKGDQNEVKRQVQRQAKLDRRDALQAQLEALDQELGSET